MKGDVLTPEIGLEQSQCRERDLRKALARAHAALRDAMESWQDGAFYGADSCDWRERNAQALKEAKETT